MSTKINESLIEKGKKASAYQAVDENINNVIHGFQFNNFLIV